MGGADFRVSNGVIDIRGFPGSADGGVPPVGGGTGTGGRVPGIDGADLAGANGVIDIRGLRGSLSGAGAAGSAAGGAGAAGVTAGAGGGVWPSGRPAGGAGVVSPGAAPEGTFSFRRGSGGGVSSLMGGTVDKIQPQRNQKDALAVFSSIRQ